MGPSSGGASWRILPTLVLHCTVFFDAFSTVAGIQKLVHCSETAPLKSKYFFSFYEAHRQVVGCASTERSSDEWQVHAVRINPSSKDVLVTVSDDDDRSRGVVLLLDSPSPVRWRLSFVGKSVFSTSQRRQSVPYVVKVYATLSSEIYSSNIEPDSLGSVEAVLNGASSASSDGDFESAIRTQYGAVTTFSKISGANRISIQVSQEESRLPSDCRLTGEASAPPRPTVRSKSAVFAYKVTKRSATGCFHSGQAGRSSSDVHVIDLVSTGGEVGGNVESAVYLSLLPEDESEHGAMRRNLTLVLVSRRRVKWFLESRGLAGRLQVLSNNGPVENYSLASGQDLETKRFPTTVPSSFDKLWKLVIAETGSLPMSYMKVEVANVLSMIIPTASKRDLGGTNTDLSDNKARFLPDAAPPFSASAALPSPPDPAPVVIPGKVMENARKQKENEQLVSRVELLLSGKVTKECDQAETVVAVPLPVAEAYAVTGMTLNEQHCEGAKNSTHWVLRTKSTSCGSLNAFIGPHPTLSNNVHLKFRPGSELDGLEIRLPFSCKFQSGMGQVGVGQDDEDEVDDDDVDDDQLPDSREMYKMRVFRRSQRDNISEMILSESGGKSATANVGDQLTVATEFRSKSTFGLSIERCWLSDNDRTDVRAANDDMWLLWKGCPPSPPPTNVNNVVLVSTAADGNDDGPSFHFDVTKQHLRMRKMYIFCVIGLCSRQPAFAQGNIGLCLNSSDKCASGMEHDEYPAAQQLTKRGPIHVVDSDSGADVFPNPFPSVVSDYSENETTTTTRRMDRSPPLHSSHIVMVGVPSQVAACIALATFAFGAALAGTLCCLFHRKSWSSKRKYGGENEDSSAETGGELQSMILSPSAIRSQSGTEAAATA